MAITRTNLRESIFTTIKTELGAITDPLSGRSINDWIFPYYPDEIIGETVNFPFITLDTEIKLSKGVFGGNTLRDLTIGIIIYSKDLQQVKQLADNVSNVMLSSIPNLTIETMSDKSNVLLIKNSRVYYTTLSISAIVSGIQ